MINVKKVKDYAWRVCLNCRSKEGYEIEVSNGNQGVAWTLCKDCIDELIKKIKEVEYGNNN